MGLAERHAAGELRVQKALEKIERAQNDLNRACQELSAIVGAQPFWRRASRLSDLCKHLWYAVHERDRAKWRLDHEPEGGS